MQVHAPLRTLTRLVLPVAGLVASLLLPSAARADQTSGSATTSAKHKYRMIVLTDLDNEPDDSQMFIRLLMYANEVDIEGLIAVSGCWLHAGMDPANPASAKNRVHPEEAIRRVEAYGLVRDHLLKNAPGWPTKEYLLSKVGAGPDGYGMGTVGDGDSTSGSKLIIEALERADSRPIYFCVDAGANCLAQALWDYRKNHSPEQLAVIIKKIRVYDDSGQDNAPAWISHEFPEIPIVRSQQQVFGLMGAHGPYVWQPYPETDDGQHLWTKEHIQTNHGPLGALYPDRLFGAKYMFLEGGNTTTWIGLVNHGLYDPEQVTWGGWGGRFKGTREQVPAGQDLVHKLGVTEKPYQPFYMHPQAVDKWIDPETGKVYNTIWTPVQRWRRAFQNDFQARMEWCVKEFKDCNHNPVAAFNGDTSDTIVHLTARPGQEMLLNASASNDPDQDTLTYSWYPYPEAGTYAGELSVPDAQQAKTHFVIPASAGGKQIHIILEVQDHGKGISLFAYRRVVIDVQPN